MCGIAGFHGQGDQEIIKKMTNKLERRGPDDEGFYSQNDLHFGFRRLSIIDLSGGHQPMSNEDETIWAMLNGEIYNFKALKEELEAQGHKFKSKSDTEVVVHLYEQWGTEFLNKLNGMFAIAIWDKKSQRLILARDRLGQKPLYYSVVGDTLIFSSEIKSALEHPLVKKELDYNSLNKYFLYEYVPAPNSIIKNLNKLEAGHFVVWQNKQLINEKYWDVSFGSQKSESSHHDTLNNYNRLLENSVKKRLVSDVPLGIFLSGGIDSSTITYFASKNSNSKIKTFSIGFDDKSFDETDYAEQVAKYFKTEHYHKKCSPKDLIDTISDIARINDEPLADASILPTHLLSKFTREKVTVALGGDGGDEFLAGYPTFQAMKLAKIIRLLPRVVINFISKLANLLPVSMDNFSFDFKIKRLLSGYDSTPEIQNQIWLGSFNSTESKKLFTNNARNKIDFGSGFSDIKKLLKKVESHTLSNRLLYLYQKQYLADDILVKADRASMYNSLEVRAPFLDHELVEFTNSLPYNLKLNKFTTKYILKESMKGKLPDNILNRSKKGFGVPIGKWINEELRDFTDQLLNSNTIKSQGIFNYDYIHEILKEHRSNTADHRKKIWTLMMFQIWYNNFITE
jgi:asparagine synthase (glutamine-hydrolysing)